MATAALALSAISSLAAERAPKRLPRENLLLYRARDGSFRPVKSRRDWQRRRADILAGMQEIMGLLPRRNRVPLSPRVEEAMDCGSYIRQLVSYAADAGSRTPAFLLIPKDAERTPAPAALALHPTHMEHGHRAIVGLAKTSYANYAIELAERGWVVLAPAYPLMADYQPDLAALGYFSGTMKAIWDNIRGIDYLQTLRAVKRGSVAAVGHSLGGHNAIYTAVFDQRIRCVVSSCGFDSFLEYYNGDPSVWQPGNGWVQNRYMMRLQDYAGRLEEIPFDFYELIAALAPRTCFVNAPLRDSNFRYQSVQKIIAAAREVYALYGAENLLSAEYPDAAHEFPEAIRERSYTMMREALGERKVGA